MMINTKKSLPILLSFSLAILLFSYPAISEAATYYVSNSGSATWAQCTNINTPCAVQTAFDNAAAGDIVYFRGGTYNVSAKNFGSTYHGYYEPANSGTSGNPITFAAYTGETPIFNGTAGGTGDVPELATIFGTFGRSYIVFDGFNLQADNGTKMARVHIGSDDSNVVSTDITVKNCIFNGGSTVITSTDNREGLRVDYVSGLTAQRNRFYNYRQTSNWPNTGAVKMYHDTNIIFENNEIYNCTAGLFYKSDVINAVTRYNYIHDCYFGIFSNAWAAGYNMDGHTYSHNVISNCSYSAMHLYAEGGTFNNLTVNNNTIYNSLTSGDLYGIFIGANANYNASNSQTVHSNIILGTTYKLTFAQGTISESQYNQYGNAGSFNVRTHYGAGAVTYTSLTAWHNSAEVVGGVHPEGATTLNGLASDPLFQNSSGNMSQLNDFRLANNSPSKGTGKGGVDMGANIDSVGTGGSGGGDTPPPSDGGNTPPPSSGSGGDSSSSGGSGCGFVRDDSNRGSESQSGRVADIGLMILLVLALTAIALFRKIKFLKGLFFLIIFLFPFSIANAADYYVATNGSDSNPGTEALPWQHIAWATCGGSYGCPITTNNPNKLAAGDTLYIRGVTYNEYNIKFTNSGAAGNPITIKGYTGEVAIVDAGFTAPDGLTTRAVFDIDGNNYIILDSLTIMRGQKANVRIGYNLSTTNITVRNCNIMNVNAYDNSGEIYVHPLTDNILIENNKLHGRGSLSYGLAGNGIHIFYAGNLIIRNNEIYNSGGSPQTDWTHIGIHYKGSVDNGVSTIIENNLIYNQVRDGILINKRDAIMRNNIIYNTADFGIRVFEESSSCDKLISSDNKILHNTIVDIAKGIWLDRSTSCPGAINTLIKDNIIYNFNAADHRGLSVWPYSGSDTSNTTFDHNLIYSSSFSSPIRVLGNYYTTSTAPLAGTGNIQQAPIFKDYTNKDFTLLPNSPGYKAASDGYNMGADTSLPPTPTPDGGGTTPPPSSGSGSESSASGGSGCGFVKDNNGKGRGANGEGVVFVIMLIITLLGIVLFRVVFKRRATTAKARSEVLNFKSGLIGLTLLFLFAAYTPAHATVYFYFDAEDGTVGNILPNPPICSLPCSGSKLESDGTYQSSGGAPQGAKYFQWTTYDSQPNAYTEIHPAPTFPINNVIGKTFYLAYFFNFTRINALDIWHTTGQSADKGVEIVGDGIRWLISRGAWSTLANNQDHHYTVWTGNPTYHLNLALEHGDIYWPNQNGYSNTNTLQLQYEHWYAAVMVIKIAADNTGSIAFYIDGIKISEYNNIITAANNSPTITDIKMGGSIAQPAYDAPAHYRKFDALMLTDNWQDIVNGGYLNGGGDSTPPPSGGDTGGNTGGSGSDSSASGGSGCGFVKDDGKGQGAKGEGLAMMVMLIITLTIVYLIRKGKIIRRFL